MKYQHKEAFALMWYACKDCGHRERIWNSRDGVTPFGCSCSSCGKTMLHVEWQRDECAPEHKPHPGQAYWRDGTPDEAEQIIRRRIERFQDQYPCSPEKASELVAGARSGTMSEFQQGWPALSIAA